jgi:NADPH:quinone reductase-like Zn-dependent oxidoreductase
MSGMAGAEIGRPISGRQVAVTRRGGPEVLRLRDVTVAAPGAAEIVIEVEAAGIAFGDVMLREGLRSEVALPAVPGYDVAGTVVAAGEDAKLDPGERVVAWTGGDGGYATHACVPAWAAVPYASHLDPASATSLVLNYLTAFQLLHRATSIGAGDIVVVHGGGGGVGTALLELARLAGARAYATASASKHEIVRSRGAEPIDYQRFDFVEELKRMAPTGVTAVYDPIGGASWSRSRELLAPGGTLVGYGFSAATRGGRRNFAAAASALLRTPRLNMLRLVRRSHSIAGYAITEVVPARPDWYRADLKELVALLAAGKLEPIIADRYPLERAAEAHVRLGESPPIGKLVLEPQARG